MGPLRPFSDSVVLIGAGRNANNLVGTFEAEGIRIAAILDDTSNAPVLGHPVSPIDSGLAAGHATMLTVSDPTVRSQLVERQALCDAVWTSYIDPRAVLSPYAEIGEGTFIAPFVACADAVLGRHVSIMPGVVLGARVRVGDFSNVLPGATVASDVTLGSGVIVAMGARVLAGLTIGDGCRIAPNTVVTRDMASGDLTFPERARIRSRS